MEENEIIETAMCTICGEEHPITEMTEVEDGVYICNECGADNYVKCDDCGDWVNIDDTYTTYNGDKICEICHDNYYFTCDCCGEIFHEDYMRSDPWDNPICEDCYNDRYIECEHCNCAISVDDAYEHNGYYYCEECYDELFDEGGELLRDYSYKPELKTYYTDKDIEEFIDWYNTNYGTDVMTKELIQNNNAWHDLFVDHLLKIGFELETEQGNSDIPRAVYCEKMHDILGDFVYFKKDGSLDEGVEIVSHAFTLNWLRDNETMIKNALDTARDLHYRSHEGGNCGLHFHINRQYFTRDLLFKDDNDYTLESHNIARFKYNTDSVVNKMNLFFETYKEQTIQFSRRQSFGYCKFISDEQYLNNSSKLRLDTNVLNYYKNGYRYKIVNNNNDHTIEIRIFRGTLIFETFMASAEFVFSLANIVHNPISKISWSKVVNNANYKYMKNYCKEREIKNMTNYLKDYARENEKGAKNALNVMKELVKNSQSTIEELLDAAKVRAENDKAEIMKDIDLKIDDTMDLQAIKSKIRDAYIKIDSNDAFSIRVTRLQNTYNTMYVENKYDICESSRILNAIIEDFNNSPFNLNEKVTTIIGTLCKTRDELSKQRELNNEYAKYLVH